MVTQLFHDPDIFCIKVPLPDSPLKDLNAYILRGQTRSLMIDTGFNRPECLAALRAGMAELNLAPGTTDVFLTHLHSDHTGLVWEMIDRGATVYMSRAEADYLHAQPIHVMWARMDAMFRAEGFPEEEAVQQNQRNHARRYAPKPDFPITPLDDGDTLLPWGARCIATPGHSPGHMCLYLPKEQILFSGDHILFDITPNISIWHHVPSPLQDYLTSLRKVQTLPVRLTLPGHREGGGAPGARIEALFAHHNRRLDEIFSAVAAAPGSTAYELAAKITWSMRGLPWPQFPSGQKWFATGETLTHLIALAADGRITRVPTGDVYRYYPLPL